MSIILEKLFKAADNHGADTGQPDHTVGDLQGLLRSAWKLMTPIQQVALLKSDEVESLVEVSPADDISVAGLLGEHAGSTPEMAHTFEGFRHADLAAAVYCFDNKEQTTKVAGEVVESAYALAARFIRSVVDAQLQKTPVFWYSWQHGSLKVRTPQSPDPYDGYTWHPVFTGVNAMIQVIGIPSDWPTPAMEDAFAESLPRYRRDEVDHPNDAGRIKTHALFDEDNFRKAMLAALHAAPTLGEAEKAVKHEAVRAAVVAGLTGTYYCSRQWSAWSQGTMTQDDFSPAETIDDVVNELTSAAVAACISP